LSLTSNTKFTTRDIADMTATDGCSMFPSIAPAAKPKLNVTGSILSSGETVKISIDGAIYMVGHDVHLSATTSTARILDTSFPLTKVYDALVNGALYYIREPKIDILVLGLPMNTYDQHRVELRERMVGGHTLPNPARRKNPGAPESISVEVAQVRVLPQPVGAFFNYCVPRGIYDQMQAQTNLVLDIGHGTFDWFLAKGNQPIQARCGAAFGGVSKIVDAVANAISPSLRENHPLMEDLDLAIRTGQLAFVDGQEIDVANQYKAVIADAVKESVSTMLRSVGNLADVRNILVTGGGASVFADELRKAIPARQLMMDTEPIFSNVRGFQMAGERWLAAAQNAA